MNFNFNLRDSQSTYVEPISAEKFDINAYENYELEKSECIKAFERSKSDLLVYRRVRADGVFYDLCTDRKKSLEMQLGALKYSMNFQADIPNFLEPWYGIGYINSCFGGKYIWHEDAAPSVKPIFSSVDDLLKADATPIHETAEGKEMLATLEYFLDKTKGKLPVSFTDVQAPINMLGHLIEINNLFIEIIDCPENVNKAALKVADLLIEFLNIQRKIIGDSLANPGHGFASSRYFSGLGMSADNSIMISNDDYTDIFAPIDGLLGKHFGGTVFHSCGKWENKINMVKNIPNLIKVDAAFSKQTDPDPNEPEIFVEEFAGSDIVINARAVGNSQEAYNVFKQLWKPNQKLIAVTYCNTPQEQLELYNKLKNLKDNQYEV